VGSYRIKTKTKLSHFSTSSATTIYDQSLKSILNYVKSFYSFELQVFDMRNNCVSELSEKFFTGLSKLEIVDFIDNQLAYLAPETFHGLKCLKNIELRGNLLEKISVNAFKELKKLVLIDLSYNNLTNIDNDTFNGLPNLRKIDLRSNRYLKTDYLTNMNIVFWFLNIRMWIFLFVNMCFVETRFLFL